MTEDRPKRSSEDPAADLLRALDVSPALLDWLYAQSKAGSWGVRQERFAAVLQSSAKKAMSPGGVTSEKLEQYLRALHLEDLALATACASGVEAAWEHFCSTYRSYLRAAAAAVLRCQAGSAEACDLADSLFSDLYG